MRIRKLKNMTIGRLEGRDEWQDKERQCWQVWFLGVEEYVYRKCLPVHGIGRCSRHDTEPRMAWTVRRGRLGLIMKHWNKRLDSL